MRNFGIELEFVSEYIREVIAQMVRGTGVDCVAEGYNHNTRRHWKVITDASCGFEIVSPVLSGEAGIEETKKVCDVLERVAKVNKAC